MDEIARQRQFEDQFLSQIRSKATALTRGLLPADRVVVERMPEGIDGVRATLTRLEVFDRELLHRLPGTNAVQLTFQKSVLGGLFHRTASRVRAQVLAPIDALATGGEPGPVSREQVLDALARYDVLPRGQRPTGVVFASPTGFSAAARALVQTYGPPMLVLMGGREDGGWDVDMPAALANTPWSKLFELESQDELLNRLTHHLDANADLMDSRGMSMDELSGKLGLPREKLESLVRRAVRGSSRLMTVVHEGRIHVCRTPLAEEGNQMSIWSRVRKLLRLKPTVAERVRDMTVQRVRLEQQRHEFDSKINALEAEEVRVVKQGAAASTDIEKKQLAGKMVRVRRELGRHKAQADMLSKQIDILGTHVHHLTLTERGRRMELPKAEELTREAAQAERIMAELSANADLAMGIEVTGQSPMMSEEEADILAEFEAAAGKQAGASPQVATERPISSPETSPIRSGREASASSPPPIPQKEKSARPEMS